MVNELALTSPLGFNQACQAKGEMRLPSGYERCQWMGYRENCSHCCYCYPMPRDLDVGARVISRLVTDACKTVSITAIRYKRDFILIDHGADIELTKKIVFETFSCTAPT